MIALLSVCVGVIFAVSVYLILSRELKSVAMGVFTLSHAVHMGILAMSGSPLTPGGEALSAPVLSEGAPGYVDPLPQALILTSIVISFAMTAVVLTLVVVTHRRAGTLRIERLAPSDRPDPPGLA